MTDRIANNTLDEWAALAIQDDAFNWMAPSDLRCLVGHAQRQAARIAELEAAQEWQPITTCPKDGAQFDVWCGGGFRRTDCKWGVEQYDPSDAEPGVLEYRPDEDERHKWWWQRIEETVTHWMPKPDAPRAALASGATPPKD